MAHLSQKGINGQGLKLIFEKQKMHAEFWQGVFNEYLYLNEENKFNWELCRGDIRIGVAQKTAQGVCL